MPDDVKIDAHSKIFFVVFFVAIIVSATTMYYKFMVIEEYDIFLAEEIEEMPAE